MYPKVKDSTELSIVQMLSAITNYSKVISIFDGSLQLLQSSSFL